MNGYIEIVNEMPMAVRIRGRNYQDTKKLSMREVVLFIERDLYRYLKQSGEIRPNFSVCLIKQGKAFEVRVHITITTLNAAEALRRRIESLLWSYNNQVLVHRQGQLVPLAPRFLFDVEISQYEELALAQSSSF